MCTLISFHPEINNENPFRGSLLMMLHYLYCNAVVMLPKMMMGKRWTIMQCTCSTMMIVNDREYSSE